MPKPDVELKNIHLTCGECNGKWTMHDAIRPYDPAYTLFCPYCGAYIHITKQED